MNTTINRKGQVTQLKAMKNKESGKVQLAATVSYQRGYAKFFFDENEVPDGLMLKDKVEVSFVFEEQLMTEPKFKIGDYLYSKEELEHYKKYTLPILEKTKDKNYISLGELNARYPRKLRVLEILIQICYGGEQIHYSFRHQNGTDTMKFTEDELTNEEI